MKPRTHLRHRTQMWRRGALAVAVIGSSLVIGTSSAVGAEVLPVLTPGLAQVAEGDTGTTTVHVPVTLSEPATHAVTVDWQTIYGPGINPPNPATPGEDFVAANGAITIPAGETNATVTLEITGDTAQEADEYIVVAFTGVVGAQPGGYLGLGFAIIEDDDTPPTLRPGHTRVLEGDTGTTTLDVPVTLSEPTTEAVTVDWATTVLNTSCSGATLPWGCAMPGTDYRIASGTLTIPAGDITGVVSLEVFGDNEEEPDEILYFSIDNPTNAVLGDFRFGSAFIDDDDAPPPRSVTLVPALPVNGGDTVTVTGSGWTPGAAIGFCQSVTDPRLVGSPADGCFFGTGSPSFTEADQNGDFSVPLAIYRWGYIGALDLTVDCTEPASACVVGAAELDDILGTATVTALPFSTPPPPPAVRGEVTVVPSTDLGDGQAVTIVGAGFRPNQVIDLHQCVVIPVFVGPTGCDWGTRARTTTDGTGAFSSPFVVARGIQFDCATRTCYLVASEAVDFVGTYVAAPISFTPPP